MDFETAKENIQPLRQGRRVDCLETALSEQSKETLENEKRQYEEAISNYEGPDPLNLWFEYICWIEQAYPKSGTESGLDEAVLKCIVHFENNTNYRQDRRMIKLFIKYIDTQDNPQELYSTLYSNGIGTLVSDLYIAWSYYFDALNNYKQVEEIFRKGIDAGAEPKEDLTQAHQAFAVSMSKRMLYDDEGSKQQFQVTMEEKRSALTSLKAHRKKYVGSVRSGIAVRDANPGTINQENVASTANAKALEVHEDVAEAAAIGGNVSVIKSIIDSARKKENTHEPGPWNKAKSGKHGNLFGKAGASNQLDFAIMEDEILPPIPCLENLFKQGVQLPAGFVSCNKPQKPWNIPIFIEEPNEPRSVPCYDKFLCYPNVSTEISPEELWAYKWFKKREIQAPIVHDHDLIWSNVFENGARIPPGFVSKNVEQVEKEEFEMFVADDDVTGFQTALVKIYPKDGEEFSLEENLMEKFKRGGIKLVTEEDFEEIDDMDITDIGDRRQSVYVPNRLSFMPRKSIVMRKSVLPPPSIEEEDDDEEMEEPNFELPAPQSLGAIRKSIIKRKNDEVPEQQPKKEFVADTPPRSAFNNDVFKPPQPVERKQVGFFVDEDDANDTCSTQQFNLFIKAQSVSTPVTKKRQPLQPTESQATEISPEPEVVNSVRISTDQQQSHAAENLGMKQLSTIMETTETTQSTKSSVSSENETDLHPKTPRNPHHDKQHVLTPPEIDQRLFNPLLASFRMPEDQTETCTKITFPIKRIANESTKLATPMKPGGFEIFQDESISVPPPSFEPSKSSSSESSSKSHVTQIEIPEMQPPTEVSFVVPVMLPDAVVIDIPVLQQRELSFEVLSTQNIDDFEVSIADDDFELPATQEFDIPATQEFEIPATQEIEIEPPQEFKVPTIQEPIAVDHASSSKRESIPFNIYEDSMSVNAKPKVTTGKFEIGDEGTGFLHASRKENLIVPIANLAQPARSMSDEFLDLLVSPKKNSPVTADSLKSDDLSDMLKFSGVGIETSMKSLKLAKKSVFEQEASKSSLDRFSLEMPKSATPTNTTPSLFDDDLNTEKFSMALGNFKNSTLLIDANRMPPPCIPSDDADISVHIEADELTRLMSSKEDSKTPEFKVPLPVFAAPPKQQSSFKIFEDDADDDEDLDMSKSIYIPRPTPEMPMNPEDEEEIEDRLSSSFAPNPTNCYEHTMMEDVDVSMKVQREIQASKGNPFRPEIREAMLEHCNFSQYLEDHVKTCTLLKKIPLLKPKMIVECYQNDFDVVKFVAKGAFGSIFVGKSSKNGKVYALKQEKPANLWEYYICVELMDRLKDKRMIPAFMSIEYAVIANNSSVLITQFSPYGSIIDVCNKHKAATTKNVDEYVVMVLTTQLLSIIDHLHACKIIHADVKPDNFLVMSKIEYGMRVPAIQLIDFGDAIDMDYYNQKETFTAIIDTENFVCCEMKEKRPWTYQTDLFGLAGTTHVMLFGRYMEVEKKVISWNIKSRYPRYFDKILWEQFFTTLLNVPDCFNLPNLQALKDQFSEVLDDKEKYVRDKIAEFNKAIE